MVIKKKFRLLLALIALFICLSSIEKTYAKYITSASGNTDVTISFTGNAGPDVCQDGTAVGEVYMSIVYKGQAWPIPLKLEMTREELRKYCVETAISAISSII